MEDWSFHQETLVPLSVTPTSARYQYTFVAIPVNVYALPNVIKSPSERLAVKRKFVQLVEPVYTLTVQLVKSPLEEAQICIIYIVLHHDDANQAIGIRKLRTPRSPFLSETLHSRPIRSYQPGVSVNDHVHVVPPLCDHIND